MPFLSLLPPSFPLFPLSLFSFLSFLRSVPHRSIPLPFAPFRWKHLGLEDVIIEKHLFACWSSLVSLFVFCSAPLHSVPLKTFRNGRYNYWEAPLCMWVLFLRSVPLRTALIRSVPLPFAPFCWKHFGVEHVMRLCYPPDGSSSSPKYNLLCFKPPKFILPNTECTSF